MMVDEEEIGEVAIGDDEVHDQTDDEVVDDEIGDLLEVAMAQMDTLKAGDACFSAMRVD